MSKTKTKIPEYFDKILWSYDIEKIDPEDSYREIIINSLNYGDLDHWRWINNHYGKEKIMNVVNNSPDTEIRPSIKRLSSLLFD